MSFERFNRSFHYWISIQQQTLLKSFVNTPEANPYSVPLALFKTPSTSLKINMHNLIVSKTDRVVAEFDKSVLFTYTIRFPMLHPCWHKQTIYKPLSCPAVVGLTFSYQIWLHFGVVTACIIYCDSQCRICSSPMISALDFGSRDLGSRPDWISLFVSLEQNPLPSQCLTLHPGVQMGTSGLSGKPDEMLGGNLGVE